jgi:hypothetical protein
VGRGGRGPITEKIQKVFFEITKGDREAPGPWLPYINEVKQAVSDNNGFAAGAIDTTVELKVSV